MDSYFFLENGAWSVTNLLKGDRITEVLRTAQHTSHLRLVHSKHPEDSDKGLGGGEEGGEGERRRGKGERRAGRRGKREGMGRRRGERGEGEGEMETPPLLRP